VQYSSGEEVTHSSVGDQEYQFFPKVGEFFTVPAGKDVTYVSQRPRNISNMADVWKALRGWMAYIMKKAMLREYDFFIGNTDLAGKEQAIGDAADTFEDVLFMMNDGSNHDTN